MTKLPFDVADGGAPRVIKGRGLGPDERDAVWQDREGDRWRYDFKADTWQYKANQPDVATTWLTTHTGPDGFTSPIYSPYREIGPNKNAPKTRQMSSGQWLTVALQAAAGGLLGFAGRRPGSVHRRLHRRNPRALKRSAPPGDDTGRRKPTPQQERTSK